MTPAARYCGPPGVDWPSLGGAVSPFDRPAPRWRPPGRRHAVFTHSGSAAIALALRQFDIGPGHDVLVPAYNCGSEIDAIASSGCRLVFYRVEPNARIDIDDIMRRHTPRTRAVYVTHYFGWPQDLRTLAPWCHHRGLRLIEDCALAMFSGDGRESIGAVGDAAIFSFRKSLGVPDGGALVLRGENNPPLPAPTGAPARRRITRRTLALIKASTLRTTDRLGLYGLLHRIPGVVRAGTTDPAADHAQPGMPESYYFELRTLHQRMSRLTAWTLARLDGTSIRQRRRRNYTRLAEGIRDVAGLTPLYGDLPPTVCPLSMPLVVDRRATWAQALQQRGIAATAWWAGYHRAHTWNGFADARFLKQHLLTLPVHQDLSDAQVEFMIESVRAIGRRLARAGGFVPIRSSPPPCASPMSAPATSAHDRPAIQVIADPACSPG